MILCVCVVWSVWCDVVARRAVDIDVLEISSSINQEDQIWEI